MIPFYQTGNSILHNLTAFQLLSPILLLLALLSQLILAPITNDGDEYFLYQYTTPLSIGHFSICDLILELCFTLKIFQRSTSKKRSRILRLVFFTYLTSIKTCFMIINGGLGPIGYIGWVNIGGIYAQIISCCVLFNLLDKLCEDIGILYGGIPTYNALLVCTELCWFFMSPITITNDSEGKQFEGLFIAFIHLSCNQNPFYACRILWNRFGYPDIKRLLLLLFSVSVMIYLLCIKVIFRFSRQTQNCTTRQSCKYHSYRLISTGSLPFRLFHALYLSRAAIPHIDQKFRSLYATTETCVIKRSVPSMLDEMCYGFSVIAQSPANRPSIKKPPFSWSFFMLKIVGCGILHLSWASFTKISPSFVHETDCDVKERDCSIEINSRAELTRMLRCLCVSNGVIVGVLSVIGDLVDFPVVSFMGFINIVIHCERRFQLNSSHINHQHRKYKKLVVNL